MLVSLRTRGLERRGVTRHLRGGPVPASEQTCVGRVLCLGRRSGGGPARDLAQHIQAFVERREVTLDVSGNLRTRLEPGDRTAHPLVRGDDLSGVDARTALLAPGEPSNNTLAGVL